MTETRISWQKSLILILISVLLMPYVVEARHRNSLDTSSLDDDPVEEFPIPILFGVELSDITPDFGDPRGGGTRLHEGQDMRAPEGTPIVSPTEAVVSSVGEGASAGNYVYTRNPGGETFRYMHLKDVADIGRGDKLSVGDYIGTVGDTGNAPDGVYHLHLEVRDEDNDPTDPYDRFGDSFTLKEKVSFLSDIFRDRRDDEEYAEFLVTTFASDFTAALSKEYNLPNVIEEVLEDSEVGESQRLLAQLNKLIDSIPALLVRDLGVGDQGGEVSLLQTYLILRGGGEAHDQLVRAGATGYYGSITSAAVAELQETNGLAISGVWSRQTSIGLAK